MMTTVNSSKIAPSTRGGVYTLDQAMDAGLLEGAVSYRSSGRPQSWVLVYNDGRMGRAIVTCYGFELLSLALDHRGMRPADREPERRDTRPLALQQRPTKWRDAS